jgi:hypothetical protein
MLESEIKVVGDGETDQTTVMTTEMTLVVLPSNIAAEMGEENHVELELDTGEQKGLATNMQENCVPSIVGQSELDKVYNWNSINEFSRSRINRVV